MTVNSDPFTHRLSAKDTHGDGRKCPLVITCNSQKPNHLIAFTSIPFHRSPRTQTSLLIFPVSQTQHWPVWPVNVVCNYCKINLTYSSRDTDVAIFLCPERSKRPASILCLQFTQHKFNPLSRHLIRWFVPPLGFKYKVWVEESKTKTGITSLLQVPSARSDIKQAFCTLSDGFKWFAGIVVP